MKKFLEILLKRLLKRDKVSLLFLFFLLFSGCSVKINPNEFNRVDAKKSIYQPSKREIYQKINVLVLPFKGRFANVARDELISLLSQNGLRILNRRYLGKLKEIKLAEKAQAAGVDLDQADYIISGEVNSISKSIRYYPPIYKKGKKISRGFYEYSICVRGSIKIIKLPEDELKKSLSFDGCKSFIFYYKTRNLRDLIISTIKDRIRSLKTSLYKLFAKKGFVYEIRQKGDTIILHTTLGKEFGAKSGMRVNIYTYKRVKIPFTNEYKKEAVKIGEGEISNVVNRYDSWIVVDKLKEEVKIGDFVKASYESHWFF